MLRDFYCLWRRREKPYLPTRWIKVWLKRAYNSSALFRMLFASSYFRMRGAQVGRLVVFGKSKLGGNFKNLTIGSESALGRCELMLHEKISIGSFVVINDGALLLTASHSLGDPQWGVEKAPITVADYAWIASNAIILPGVSIGRGAVVSAGAVVRENVPDYALAIGNPAKIVPAKRTIKLSYSPVMLSAPIEAWIGKSESAKTKDSDK